MTLVAPDPQNPSDSSSSILWSFVEMTYSSVAGLFANLSFVDFVGLAAGMSLTTTSGQTQTVAGTSPGSMGNVCSALEARAGTDGVPWDQLCVYRGDEVLRVDAPGKYIAAVDGGAFRSYWDAYVTSVWEKYASETLYIDTQTDLGVVECSTSTAIFFIRTLGRSLATNQI